MSLTCVEWCFIFVVLLAVLGLVKVWMQIEIVVLLVVLALWMIVWIAEIAVLAGKIGLSMSEIQFLLGVEDELGVVLQFARNVLAVFPHRFSVCHIFFLQP